MDEKESSSIKPRGGYRPGAGRKPGVPNKLTADVKQAAAQYGEAALLTLADIMETGESEQARIAASKELLDRAYGRPRQELDVNDGRTVTIIVDRSCGGTVPMLALPNQSKDDGEGGSAKGELEGEQ